MTTFKNVRKNIRIYFSNDCILFVVESTVLLIQSKKVEIQ